MGFQRHIAQKICDKKADYVLALKGSQSDLQEATNDFFETAFRKNWLSIDYSAFEDRDYEHGLRIKNFYTGLLSLYCKEHFPKIPCYERFVHLMQRAIFPLSIFTQLKAG